MEDALRLKAKVAQRLRDHRLRPTKARIRIGMMLLESPKHLSADQIFDKLIKPLGSGLSGASPKDINGGDFSPSLFSKTNFAEAASAPLTKPQIIPLF